MNKIIKLMLTECEKTL